MTFPATLDPSISAALRDLPARYEGNGSWDDLLKTSRSLGRVADCAIILPMLPATQFAIAKALSIDVHDVNGALYRMKKKGLGRKSGVLITEPTSKRPTKLHSIWERVE